jgi:cytochrome c peroxidase
MAACAGAQQPPPRAAASGNVEAAPSAEQQLILRARQYFAALPEPQPQNPAWVALGRRLFFETRVSADGQVGCVSCHQPDKWASDGLALAKGTSGRVNPRNSPSVFNAFLQTSEHWRGDRESVEDQARRALVGPASFGLASEADAASKIAALPGYEGAFREAFPGAEAPVSAEHWATAIGAYERTLVTKGPFDAFLGGDANALSADARAGLAAFIDTGCAECHAGPLLGGREFKKFGRFFDYVSLTHSDHNDAGRFDVTHAESDRAVFKVAALRNVEHTAPYFHDGSVGSLADAVDIMAKAQLNVQLSAPSTAAIVAFLSALSAPLPAAFSPPGP